MAAKQQTSDLPGRPKKATPSDTDKGLVVFSSNPNPQALMWMPPQNNSPQETTNLHREKQRFIRANHHRKRKEQKSQALKGSTTIQLASPASSPASSPKNGSVVLRRNSPPPPNEPVIYQWIEPQVLDIFPSPKKSTKQDWNLYFNHFRLYTSTFLFPFSGPNRSVWYYNKAQEHPILIEVLTASGAFTRAAGLMLKGAPPATVRKCTQDGLQLQSQAIASLQKIFNNPSRGSLEVAISVVATMMYIGVKHPDRPLSRAEEVAYLSCQGFEASSETLNMHMNGLKIIINLLGGLDNLESKTQASLYSADCTRAFANNLCLFFNISPRWEASVHQDIAKIESKVVRPGPLPLGSSFIGMPWFEDLNPRLKTLVHAYKWCILHFEGILHVDEQYSERKNDYLVLTTYRLISLHNDTLISPFEDVIRLTLLIYSVTRLWLIPPQQCEVFLLNNFRPNVRECYKKMQETSPDLLFWVLWMAGLASFGLECHGWFVECLVECAVSRGITSWDKAVAVLERCLFVHREADEPGKILWASITKHETFI